jgi:Peptidase family M23/Putative peptidoglycan binding domain
MKLTLTYPITPWNVSQHFGGNGQYYQDNGVNVVGHNGIDIIATHGQPVYAAHDGIAWYQIDDKGGHGVIVITDKQYDYGTSQAYYKTIYWHLCDSAKEPQYRSPVEGSTGLVVKTGDLIGYADSTGLSTGDHLHFGLKAQVLQYPNEYVTLDKDNGYLGAIDPAPFIVVAPSTKYIFTTSMRYGEQSDNVRVLQKCLQSIGYFPQDIQTTGYYGPTTRSSVFRFQQENCIKDMSSFILVWAGMGSFVGSITLPVLNKFFQHE